jgi:hypothetical protein
MPLNIKKVNLKNYLKKKNFLRNCKNSTYVCACQGGCIFVLEKVPAKGTRHGQDQCSILLTHAKSLCLKKQLCKTILCTQLELVNGLIK